MSELIAKPEKALQASALPKWEQAARERLKTGLPRMTKPIAALLERDAVEADTRMLVTDLLCDVLGFDKYEDLTAEYQVKGDFADIGIRVDKQLTAFVEIKRVKQDLNKTHLRQVEAYALREGVVWAILTNARVWELYRVEAVSGQQSELTLIFSVDWLDETVPMKSKIDLFFMLTREALQKKLLEAKWQNLQASSPKTLQKVLLSDPVLEVVKKEIWREKRQRLDISDLKKLVNDLFGN